MECGVGDAAIVEAVGVAEVVGIDCPLGWPEAFVRAVEAHHAFEAWPAGAYEEASAELCYRRTDRYLQAQGIRPLSVSADRIAAPAMRCAKILAELNVKDRSGEGGRYFEVYPAAALSIWGLREKKARYKGREGAAELRALVDRLCRAAPWLELDRKQLTNDHRFDALIAALIARAAHLQQTAPIPEADREAARREGWIALPLEGSLDRMFSPRPSHRRG